ncbi:MAG: Sec-independent protein translocase protein TatB [bacterium]
MVSGIGFQEIIVILIVALILFGPKRLPELARLLGQLTRELRQLVWEFRSAMELEAMDQEDADQQENHEEEKSDEQSR